MKSHKVAQSFWGVLRLHFELNISTYCCSRIFAYFYSFIFFHFTADFDKILVTSSTTLKISTFLKIGLGPGQFNAFTNP
jgi:hypothetical protein